MAKPPRKGPPVPKGSKDWSYRILDPYSEERMIRGMAVMIASGKKKVSELERIGRVELGYPVLKAEKP